MQLQLFREWHDNLIGKTLVITNLYSYLSLRISHTAKPCVTALHENEQAKVML
jgi:hypothetical protein